MLSLIPIRRNEPEAWKVLQSCVGQALDQIPLVILQELHLHLSQEQCVNFWKSCTIFHLISAGESLISIHSYSFDSDDLWDMSPQRESIWELSQCLQRIHKFHNKKAKLARTLAPHAEACLALP